MKALSRGLCRLDPVIVPATTTGMYMDPEAPGIQVARAELIDRLGEAAPGSVVPISFQFVEVSASCIAALLGSAVAGIGQGHMEGRFVLGLDPAGKNAWDADAGLKKESERLGRKLPMVWQSEDNHYTLVGPVDEQVQTTYDFVLRRGAETGTTARDLAHRFKLSIQAASNRLTKAAQFGLLYSADRESVPGGGSQYVYVPVA